MDFQSVILRTATLKARPGDMRKLDGLGFVVKATAVVPHGKVALLDEEGALLGLAVVDALRSTLLGEGHSPMIVAIGQQ